MSENIKPINSHLNNLTLKKEEAALDTTDSSKVTRQEAPKGSPMVGLKYISEVPFVQAFFEVLLDVYK